MKKIKKIYSFIKGAAKNYVVPVGMFLVFAPVQAYAEDTIGTCETRDKPSKKMATMMFLKSSVGITKCMDPTATPLEKLHACLKPCCALTFVAATCIAENEGASSKAKFLAGSCCAISWAAFSALEGKKAFS